MCKIFFVFICAVETQKEEDMQGDDVDDEEEMPDEEQEPEPEPASWQEATQ